MKVVEEISKNVGIGGKEFCKYLNWIGFWETIEKKYGVAVEHEVNQNNPALVQEGDIWTYKIKLKIVKKIREDDNIVTIDKFKETITNIQRDIDNELRFFGKVLAVVWSSKTLDTLKEEILKGEMNE